VSEFYIKIASGGPKATGYCKKCLIGLSKKRYLRIRKEPTNKRAPTENIPEGMKGCSQCSSILPREDFYSSKTRGGEPKLHSWCKECVNRRYKENPLKWKRSHLMREYGITVEQFNEMVSIQRGRCPLCTNKFDSSKKTTTAHVDHDHATGDVREVLCQKCNMVLGLVKENEDTLRRMITYLQKHKHKIGLIKEFK
jgi:hypothetical protein